MNKRQRKKQSRPSKESKKMLKRFPCTFQEFAKNVNMKKLSEAGLKGVEAGENLRKAIRVNGLKHEIYTSKSNPHSITSFETTIIMKKVGNGNNPGDPFGECRCAAIKKEGDQ